jgi:hypothetical protein
MQFWLTAFQWCNQQWIKGWATGAAAQSTKEGGAPKTVLHSGGGGTVWISLHRAPETTDPPLGATDKAGFWWAYTGPPSERGALLVGLRMLGIDLITEF